MPDLWALRAGARGERRATPECSATKDVQDHLLSWCLFGFLRRKAMPYSPEHKHDTRQRIVGSAARLFNRKGFSEVTIGEIMASAGLTHGGFYRHFKSKDELYAEAVRQFLSRPAEPWQEKPKERCAPGLPYASYVIDAYLSREHLDDVDGACPLIGLPSDVARESLAVRSAYREVAEAMVRLFKANLDGPESRDLALVLVALCVGGMVLARAVDNEDLGNDFRSAAHKHVLATTGWNAA
jgi:TetR/AcrR family transcriptional regulator, transcriptional repressor for nem operon